MKIMNSPGEQQVEITDKIPGVSRRRFFQLAGGIAGAGVLMTACRPRSGPTNIYLGAGDTALLNFLYVLNQIEAAFYTQAVATPYYGADHKELLALSDLRDQEIAHREFFKKILGNSAVTTIQPDFSTVTFADRTSTLTSGAKIEDIVISGLIGASGLFTNSDYGLAFSKMVSVEARHSAYCRDVLNPNTLSDNTVTDVNGLGQSISPSAVLAAAGTYSHTLFDSSRLPN